MGSIFRRSASGVVMLGGGRLSPARQHGQDHIVAGDAGRQGFGAGGLDRIQPIVKHRAQHLPATT